MNDIDLAFSDALTLGREIARKRISSVELTKLYIARLERYGERFGAVVTIMHERAMKEAKAADAALARGDRKSPLHGVPYGVKDLLAAVGAPTTWGAEPYRERSFNFDGAVVEKLHAAGAVLIAKLAMVELAGAFGYNGADASFTGPGRTPWNRDFWSGGSSSGPGAAVAAGLVGFAIGSETNGSILTPSAMCGVSGLRPTFGRVSRYGAMALMWSSDKLGPMARSARDTLAILRIVAGADPRDDSTRTEAFYAPKKKPRVAVIVGARKQTQAAVVKNFDSSLAAIADDVTFADEVKLPDLPYGATIGALLNGESAAAFRDLIESGKARELQSPDDRIGGYIQYETRAVDYVDAMRRRREIVDAVGKSIAPYDALLFPTLPTVAYPIGTPFDKVYPDAPGGVDPVTPGNLCGLPSMSVPNGFGENHLPTGFGMMANPWRERDLVALAMRFQARTAFHTMRPPGVT